jgi:hypothetical protein
MLASVALRDDVSRIASAATGYAGPGEELAAVIPVEEQPGERVYLCAFAGTDGTRSWLALDDDGDPVTSRRRVRDAASVAALYEVAEETGHLPAESEPRVASLGSLDLVGAESGAGELAAAIQGALPAVDELTRDVEANYKLELI